MLRIIHAIEGRVRIKYQALYKNQGLCDVTTAAISQMQGVTNVRSNVHCASLIIVFDVDKTSLSHIKKCILSQKTPQEKVLVPQSSEVSLCAKKTCAATARQSEFSTESMEFIGLSCTAAVSFIAKKIFKTSLSSALFSPFWFATSLFALPLVHSALREIMEEKKPGFKTFLGTGVAAALLTGETLTALEILWVNSGADLMQKYVTEKSRKSIKQLLDLTAKTTFVIRNGIETEVAVEQVCVGDTVVIHIGEKISVDGQILSGEALINEASINGREELIYKKKDENVFSGTYVQEGMIHVRADKVGDNTYLARIVHAVEDSLANKAPMELAADTLAKRLITLGFIMTGGTLLFTRSLYRTLSVMLVMTCPCATTLSASSAVSSSIANAASKGILIKGGRYLEDAGAQKSFCFDKTGTITTGTPEIERIHTFGGMTEKEVLSLAYIAEMHSRHPIAAAVRSKAEAFGIERPEHTVCETILGMGIRAETTDGDIYVGNHKLMAKYNIDISEQIALARQIEEEGGSVQYLAWQGKTVGLFSIHNQEKQGIDRVIQFLRKDGVEELILVTGDEKQTAQALAAKFGFDECHYSVLPQQKADIIAEIQKRHKVAMIGDGINDVLALARADLGIAMGAAGTDVAIETADIALVDDDLEKIIFLRNLSHKTKQIINQNFFIATSTNLGGALLGAVGILNPVMAGLLHIAHTGGILLNSSRLLSYQNGLQKSDQKDTKEQINDRKTL